MKRFLNIAVLLLSLSAFGQVERHDDYVTKNITVTEKANGEGPFTWQVRITYHQGDPTKRITLFNHNGAGEIGTDTTFFTYPSIHSFGPHYFLSNGSGWDGGIQLGSGIIYPNYITIQPPTTNMRPWHLAAVVDTLIKNYPIDTLAMGFMGLSMGSQEWQYLMMFYPSVGDEHWMSRMRCFVDLQGEGGEQFSPYISGPAYPAALGHWAKRYGGHMFAAEGTNDSRNIWQLTQNMRDSTGNKEFFTYENWPGSNGSPGTHGGWNYMYDPAMNNWIDSPSAAITNPNLVYSSNPQSTMGTYKRDPARGTNIFQWMVKQMPDTSLRLAAVSSWAAPIQVGAGEYQVFFRGPDSLIYGISTNGNNLGSAGVNTPGLPQRLVTSPSNLKFRFVAGSLHAGGAIDVNKRVWVWGENPEGQLGIGTTGTGTTTPVMIATDSIGNTFDHVIKLVAGYAANAYSLWYAIKDDGTLWVWGPTFAGMRGDGTYGCASTRPIQLTLPGGRQVADVQAGDYLLVMCTDGTAWSTGGNGGVGAGSVNSFDLGNGYTGTQWLSFRQVTGLTGLTQIAGGKKFNFGYNGTTNKLYKWGSYGDYMGRSDATSGGGNPVTTPTEATEIEAVLFAACPSCTIKKIVTNSENTHIILSNGTLWGFGENGEGGVGNGVEVDFSTYKNASNQPSPYAFDQGTPGVLVQHAPVQIAPGKSNFADVTGGSIFLYYTYAEDSLGNLFSWGPNKGSILGNGIIPPPTGGAMEATYRNSWDVTLITPVNPLGLTKAYVTTSPYCIANPGTSPCSLYTPPTNTKPVPSLSLSVIAGNKIVADATGSTDDVHISYSKISQTSGTALLLGVPTGTRDTIQAQTGTYQFKLAQIDNAWASDSVTQTITVGTPITPPVVDAGNNITVTAPVSSATLTGSAAATGSATMSSVSYTQLTGPNTATISQGGTLTAPTATLTGLVVGVYVFQLSGTDSNGNTTTDTVQVNVVTSSSQEKSYILLHRFRGKTVQ